MEFGILKITICSSTPKMKFFGTNLIEHVLKTLRPVSTFRFSVFQIKISVKYFTGIKKIDFKVYMKRQGTRIGTKVLKN